MNHQEYLAACLTDEQAAELVGRIIPLSDNEAGDDAARALTAIIERLAHQDDHLVRDSDLTALTRAIYALTAECDWQRVAFIEASTGRQLGAQASVTA
jgi:hypothetical protein